MNVSLQMMQQQHDIYESMQLPRLEMMTFDGNPLKSWAFVNSFANTVGCTQASDQAKLARLLQCCKGKAYQVIECCAAMQPSQGYARAKSLLEQRFGNDYVVAEAWVEKVIGGPQIKASDAKGLQEYSDDLRSCYETLNAMDKLSEVGNRRCVVKLDEKLPLYLQNRFRKIANEMHVNRSRYPSFKEFAKIFDTASKEANDPVFGISARAKATSVV
ncbi:uncharacterized protein LOC135491586 [Lineus longissimus]|uniref:uncharacterized protein LOC135491586 n=1 Tax=Lineus longissimus TaxID=88925 RepID=UPI00315C6AEE